MSHASEGVSDPSVLTDVSPQLGIQLHSTLAHTLDSHTVPPGGLTPYSYSSASESHEAHHSHSHTHTTRASLHSLRPRYSLSPGQPLPFFPPFFSAPHSLRPQHTDAPWGVVVLPFMIRTIHNHTPRTGARRTRRGSVPYCYCEC